MFSALTDITSSPLIWPALVLLGIIGIAAQKYFAYKRLAHFKGPFWASWTELWLAKVTWDSQIPFALRDVNKKYGTPSSYSVLNNFLLCYPSFAPGLRYFQALWQEQVRIF
jgi:hypothetical protein